MRIIPVNDLSTADLRHFRTLRRPVEHHREGVFVAEGEKVVLRLLDSGLPVVSVLLTPAWLDTHRAALERAGVADVYVAPRPALEAIVGFHLHQGIMALGRVPVDRPLEDILADVPLPRLLVALDGLANAENVGVVVRNCAALGVGAVIVGETSSSPYLRRAVRNSMGTVFRLPVFHSPDLAATLAALRSGNGIRVIAAHPANDGRPLATADLTGNVCLVFGSEGDGVRPEILAACDAHSYIAMERSVDSLNVASASAAFLWEASRQRSSHAG